MTETTPQTSREGGGRAPNARAEIPLPMEGPPPEQVDARKKAVTLWEAHTGAGFLAGLVASLGNNEILFPKDFTSWKGPMLEQFIKNCSPWEELIMEKSIQLHKATRLPSSTIESI